MKTFVLSILFTLIAMAVTIIPAQTMSIQDLNEQMNIWSSFENDLLNERFQLNEALNDSDTVVFYYPESERWISMPRAQAIEFADRLIVIAEMNPTLLSQLQKRLGLGWFLVEQALETPGVAADSLISLIEARQRPQLEAVLADYDALLDQVRNEFANVKTQRDALFNNESIISCDLNGFWSSSLGFRPGVELACDNNSCTGTYTSTYGSGRGGSETGQIKITFPSGSWGEPAQDGNGFVSAGSFKDLKVSDDCQTITGFWDKTTAVLGVESANNDLTWSR